MVQIRKKTGLVQSFDSKKIIEAVKKSADRVNVEMSSTKNNRLIEIILEKIQDKEVVDVKDLHNLVEIALDEVDHRVAQSYRDYRNYKKDFSAIIDRVYNKKISLDSESDRSNANADSSLITTQKSIILSELNALLYDKFFLNEEEREAVNEGYIYIHDKGSRYDSVNCFERGTRFITSEGVKSFYDFKEGDTVLVISHKGVWRKATVIKRPWQKIQRVWFKRGSGDETYVDCTQNHRWLLKDGSVTTSLKVGDILIDTPESGQKTNYGMRKERSLTYGMYNTSGRNNWFVSRIEEIKLNSKSSVWCLDVEEDHSFLLEKGIPTGNCCIFDMKSVLSGGFRMGNIDYTEPKSLDVAFDVIADVAMNAASAQYGGFTIPEMDKLLAPYAEMSYKKYYQEYKDIKLEDGIEVDENKADKYAYNKVKRDMEQGVQGLDVKFNSCSSSRGDYPFTSITFGLGTGKWETLFSSVCMKVRKEGQGNKIKTPVLFPKLSFFYDPDLHGEGKPLEWLFDEAIDCSSKTMYPDFISLEAGYQGEIYKKYKTPISRMGCVDPKETVIYKYNNITKVSSIKNMWDTLSKIFKIHSQRDYGFDSGEVIPLKGVSILDKTQFVDCKFIIKNEETSDWYKVTLENGLDLICTGDHLWSIDNEVKRTIELNINDEVETIGSTLESYNNLENNNCLEGFIVNKLNSSNTIFYKVKNIERIELNQNSYDVTTESEHFYCSGIRSHNCRAQLSPWFIKGGMNPADDTDIPVFIGRHNLGAITLHFPMIVAKAKEEKKDFFEVLEYYMDLVRGIHKKTYKYLSHKKAGTNPLGFCQGGFLNGYLDPDQEIGEDFLRPMTMSFGIIALNEASVLQTGKSISEDNSFALSIMKYINEYIAKYKKIDNILYAAYGVPGETLCIKQVQQFRKKYGIIKDVSDHEYTTNSFHCCVRDNITPIEKQDIEYPLFHLCTGGNIQYCRYPIQYNIEAIKTLVRRAMKMGFYEGVNLQLNTCADCGEQFIDRDTCPKCNSENIIRVERMNGYLGFSRINGKSMYSDGKLIEFKERVSM